MGTENSAQQYQQYQQQAPKGRGVMGRAASGTIEKMMNQYREDQSLAAMDRQRRQQARRSNNIRQAETNRAARVAREPQVQQPAPPSPGPWG